jgi:NTP pyrophosphatase (non-canonical NTP hydrolase)
MDWSKMQREHRLWLSRKYPGQPPEIPAAGLVEEAGELLHAVLKLEMVERWGPDERYGDLQASLIDAVGDCAIFACSLCNSLDWDFSGIVNVQRSLGRRTSLQQAQRVVVFAADAADPPYTQAKLRAFIAEIRAGWADFEGAVKVTWEKVGAR